MADANTRRMYITHSLHEKGEADPREGAESRDTIGMGINHIALWRLKMKPDMGRKSSRMLKKKKKSSARN